MKRKMLLTLVVIAGAVNLSATAFAGANNYVFEPVNAQVKKGDDVIVSVRLKHKPTGKVVTDAVIVQTRIDMARREWPKWPRHSPPYRAMSPAFIPSRPTSRWRAGGS